MEIDLKSIDTMYRTVAEELAGTTADVNDLKRSVSETKIEIMQAIHSAEFGTEEEKKTALQTESQKREKLQELQDTMCMKRTILEDQQRRIDQLMVKVIEKPGGKEYLKNEMEKRRNRANSSITMYENEKGDIERKTNGYKKIQDAIKNGEFRNLLSNYIQACKDGNNKDELRKQLEEYMYNNFIIDVDIRHIDEIAKSAKMTTTKKLINGVWTDVEEVDFDKTFKNVNKKLNDRKKDLEEKIKKAKNDLAVVDEVLAGIGKDNEAPKNANCGEKSRGIHLIKRFRNWIERKKRAKMPAPKPEQEEQPQQAQANEFIKSLQEHGELAKAIVDRKMEIAQEAITKREKEPKSQDRQDAEKQRGRRTRRNRKEKNSDGHGDR